MAMNDLCGWVPHICPGLADVGLFAAAVRFHSAPDLRTMSLGDVDGSPEKSDSDEAQLYSVS
jgi:hypothetical protein